MSREQPSLETLNKIRAFTTLYTEGIKVLGTSARFNQWLKGRGGMTPEQLLQALKDMQ